MHERLVESWLDSASERSYQAPFVQMLAAQGHRIVHSTRHGAIEFGKDVITVDPDGIPCGYQLKGHPGGRLTLNGFRDIEPQIRELLNHPISLSGLPKKPHRSFLVTNGYVDEEATLAIREMNEGNVRDGYPDRQLHVLKRGDLLAIAKDLGHSLWPTEIEQIHLLLEMLVETGRGAFPLKRADGMLAEILQLRPVANGKVTATDLKRRVTSAALMTSISLTSFSRSGNHVATIAAWTQFCTAAIAACTRHGHSYSRNAAVPVGIAATAIKDTLIDLGNEVLSRRDLVEGDAMVDGPFYRARHTLVLSLLALLWFWLEDEEWPDDLDKSALEAFLLSGKDELNLWGEGAMPQVLTYHWARRRLVGGIQTENFLAQLLYAVIAQRPHPAAEGLASPYWTFEDVTRHQLAPILGVQQDEMRREAVGGRSYFAEALLHLLVRANRKQACIQLWPDISRSQFAAFIPMEKWEYCMFRAEKGDNSVVLPSLRKEWSELVEEARSIRCDEVPSPLLDLPLIHMLFLIFYPYRATAAVVRRIAPSFDHTWLIADPVE